MGKASLDPDFGDQRSLMLSAELVGGTRRNR
jgi:hypothetical protein